MREAWEWLSRRYPRVSMVWLVTTIFVLVAELMQLEVRVDFRDLDPVMKWVVVAGNWVCSVVWWVLKVGVWTVAGAGMMLWVWRDQKPKSDPMGPISEGATTDGDDDPFFNLSDGTECVHEELALHLLLRDEVLFANERDYYYNGERAGSTIVFFVRCNDLFYWACGDSEDLPFTEIGALFKRHRDDPRWGVSKWCCVRRQMQPQAPIRRKMKEAGVWDEEMESLPLNPDAAGKGSDG